MRKYLCCLCGAAIALPMLTCGCAPKGEERSLYRISAEYTPETKMLSATMTAEIVNPSEEPLSSLKFELWPNAYREGAKYAPVSSVYERAAYYSGKNYGRMHIKAVRGGTAFEVGGEDENILTVTLQEELSPGERAAVEIDFDVALASVAHRLGVTKKTVNLANFYPILCNFEEGDFREYVYSYNGDPFVSVCADYDVTLTLPETYTVATGFAAEERIEEGKKICHVAAENVRDVAFVLGENFQCVTAETDGVEVAYYYYGGDPEGALSAATDSLAYYSETFGKYAYPRYAVVETELFYGGMEFPALSMISSSLRGEEVATVVAHETAHQWWYAMVGSNQFEHAWQDEGLAEYSAALFLGSHPEYGVSYEDVVSGSERAYRAYYSVRSQLSGEADTTMDRALTAYSGEYEYRSIAYDKGVILFDRIRDVAGEKKLTAALSRYFTRNAGKIASPAELKGCFEDVGANAAKLFDCFTEGLCVI